jgi:secondary thiamine-phosphate synthase enzyme
MKTIEIETKGEGDNVNLTPHIEKFVKNMDKGLINIFVLGSTAGISTLEYEPGLKKDFPEILEKLVPKREYAHNQTWGCNNGQSHIKAALIGPSLTIPIHKGRPMLGQWQQIVLFEFDTRPRLRKVLLTPGR